MPPRALEVGVERRRPGRGRRGRARISACAASVLVEPVEGELTVAAGLRAQLAMQVAQREVGEVERPLTGQREVRRERGVAGDAGQRPAALGRAPAAGP